MNYRDDPRFKNEQSERNDFHQTSLMMRYKASQNYLEYTLANAVKHAVVLHQMFGTDQNDRSVY
jgi:hypothetical protein